MVVAVTGAGGHLGINLVRTLLSQHRQVRAVDIAEPLTLTALGATWVAADVRDRDAMRDALTDCEIVFHLAGVISTVGSKSGLVESVNVGGVASTARAALDVGVPRFVHCSSIHAYDLRSCRGQIITEDSPRSTGPHSAAYDRSKADGEEALREVIADGLDAVILNPSGIIGPLDLGPSRAGAVLLAAARGRLPATVEGNFDWVDVRDVVAALMAAEHSGRTGENYLIGGASAGLDELAEMAAQATGARAPLTRLPMWFARIWAPAATAVGRAVDHPLLFTHEALNALEDQPHIDHRRATEDLGHHPRPLTDTVTDLIASFADAGRVSRRPATT